MNQSSRRMVANSPSGPAASGATGPHKSYDYVLKFLLVGDSDVGKQEILDLVPDEEDEQLEGRYRSDNVACKSTTILLDGKRIKLLLWDTSGQGRFSTVIRSYSRGAQGILLVYDITNKWSFSGLSRWIKEIDQHSPGVPKVLIGNRLHYAFRRQVNELSAENYARKHNMLFLEVSPLCNYNITESFTQLARMALQRNGMDKLWRNNNVASLQELCCRTISQRISTVHHVESLPLPSSVKSCLKSFSVDGNHQHRYLRNQNQSHKNSLSRRAKSIFLCDTSYLVSKGHNNHGGGGGGVVLTHSRNYSLTRSASPASSSGGRERSGPALERAVSEATPRRASHKSCSIM